MALLGGFDETECAAPRNATHLIPRLLVSSATRLAASDIAQIGQRASAATTAVHTVLADRTVVAAVRALGEHSKQRAVPDVLERLVPQIAYLQSGDVARKSFSSLTHSADCRHLPRHSSAIGEYGTESCPGCSRKGLDAGVQA